MDINKDKKLKELQERKERSKEKDNSKRLETDESPYYDLLTGEYLGVFKSKEEAKGYFVSIGMSENDYDWLEQNKHLFNGDQSRKGNTDTKVNVSVNGNDNGTYKRKANPELIWNKFDVVSQLNHCTFRTPPNKIASLLEKLFDSWPSKEGHWLWVAQDYTPRVINWVISATIKAYRRGEIRKTPAAYFTYKIRFREKRKR